MADFHGFMQHNCAQMNIPEKLSKLQQPSWAVIGPLFVNSKAQEQPARHQQQHENTHTLL